MDFDAPSAIARITFCSCGDYDTEVTARKTGRPIYSGFGLIDEGRDLSHLSAPAFRALRVALATAGLQVVGLAAAVRATRTTRWASSSSRQSRCIRRAKATKSAQLDHAKTQPQPKVYSTILTAVNGEVMSPNQCIRRARTVLGLSEQETAARANLTIYELGDIEARAEEFASAIPIQNALRLCSVLDVSIHEVLGIDTSPSSEHIPLGRYVELIREMAHLAPDELNEKIGYETGFIQRVEGGSIDLLAYPVELALDIASCTKSSPSRMLNVLEQAFRSSTPAGPL
ncbi:hypothetical protein GCM10023165_17810 [Variovorax defluvii]|uniref:HTH cro/C1-type domain-containing protein n=2 Tax=Variovorax defluvii TaxID=913761 RepID=A0ABP8HG39_9BURK